MGLKARHSSKPHYKGKPEPRLRWMIKRECPYCSRVIEVYLDAFIPTPVPVDVDGVPIPPSHAAGRYFTRPITHTHAMPEDRREFYEPLNAAIRLGLDRNAAMAMARDLSRRVRSLQLLEEHTAWRNPR